MENEQQKPTVKSTVMISTRRLVQKVVSWVELVVFIRIVSLHE